MRLELFSKGDLVLLIGEGNFSFAVNLLNHKLPIHIIATCVEPEIEFENQRENITYLESNKVPVYLDVDATKLHDNFNLKLWKFDKIIFNFPHVGGKMKIQLNRDLLKDTFRSAKHVLKPHGQMLVSLCRGQGGTPADEPRRRRWDDSWQITEMAGHGDFILVAVEPFIKRNFKDYRCVGYRSQDVEFNLEGALVHIFRKRRPPFNPTDKEIVKKRLSTVSLDKNSNVDVPVLYSELYSDNPLKSSKSVVSYFKKTFLDELEESMKDLGERKKLKIVGDDEIPVHVEHDRGIICKVDGVENGCRLRLTATQIFNEALKSLDKFGLEDGFIFFPGMYFNPLSGRNFLTDAPISFQFLLLGKNASTFGYRWIYNLTKKFKTINEIICSLRPQHMEGTDVPHPRDTLDCLEKEGNIFEGILATEWVYTIGESEYVVCHVYSLTYKDQVLDACVVYPDKLAEVLFFVESWKELWAYGHEVKIEKNFPKLRPALLYPLSYEFDITVKYSMTEYLTEDHIYRIFWLSAGQIIRKIELIDEYHSGEGWSSKCYRITYESLDKPLYRNRVIDIHNNIVGKMLTTALPVTIK